MIVAIAGRRIDAVDASVARFPLARVAEVRAELRQRLGELGATAIVSSGACGTDLLALEVASELHVRRSMVLPYSRELFRVTSVTDRPGEWGARFDAICDALAATHDLLELGLPPEGEETYALTNVRIVELAVELGRAEALTTGAPLPNAAALQVWEGMSRGRDDMTAHFGDVARECGLGVSEVLTLPR